MLGLHLEKNSTAKEKFENHWTGSKSPKPGHSTELLKELSQIMNSWAIPLDLVGFLCSIPKLTHSA